MDIPNQFEEVLILFTDNGFVAILEKMPVTCIFRAIATGVPI